MSILSKTRSAAVIVVMAMLANVSNLSAQPQLSAEQILERIVAQERQLNQAMSSYTPLVETYIQTLEPDQEVGGTRPKSDRYFLGKLDMSKGLTRSAFLNEKAFAQGLSRLGAVGTVKYVPDGFAQMTLVDWDFDRARYNFEFVRREFLGEVRCLVFDVTPRSKSATGAFLGRIWVEDRDYHIVRFNGTYQSKLSSNLYFHFDSWREQMGPNLWLPSYIYSEESDRQYFMNSRKLQFKAQTRLWGYNIGRSNAENEFTSLTVESDKVLDNSDLAQQMSPVMSQRAWERQAEDNVIQRMEKAGLLAPEGDVDKVLMTVINNLAVTNDLSITPGVRARVLLTAPLESFTIGHTIVVSRGLIDVLPDEASLAMVLAHELAHVALGHRLDTKYAFSDRMLFDDQNTFFNFFFKRDEREENDANVKGVELLNKSPYAEKLSSAGLFLRALSARSKQLPSLLQGNLGNRMATAGTVLWMPQLLQNAPPLETDKLDQVAALPLGGRLHVDPWSGAVELVKTQGVALLSPGEKLQFEIAPVFLYLTRKDQGAMTASKSKNND